MTESAKTLAEQSNHVATVVALPSATRKLEAPQRKGFVDILRMVLKALVPSERGFYSHSEKRVFEQDLAARLKRF